MAEPASSATITSIPTLPVFVKLRGRCVLLAGGSPPAAWKGELLLAAGAKVRLCAEDLSPELEALARRHPEAMDLVQRNWTPADFGSAALAIGALEGADAERFRDAACLAGVPVNVIDVPHLCDFQFGTILARSPLLIAISTDGAAPVFGQSLRSRFEALLPQTIGRWAQAAKDWRPDVQSRGLGFSARRRFWEIFSDRALDGSGRAPDESDRAACLAAALDVDASAQGGLWLVGVGPGDPDLITLRGVRALQSADVILHEAGLDDALLGLGRREARRIVEAEDELKNITAIKVWVGEGKTIAWAGCGDPDRCSRWRRRRTLVDESLVRGVVNGLTCLRCEDGCSQAR